MFTTVAMNDSTATVIPMTMKTRNVGDAYF